MRVIAGRDVLDVLKVTVVALYLCGASACARTPENLSSDAVMEDVDRLVELVEKTHPDPYAAFGGIEGFRRQAVHLREEARTIGTTAELHALAQRFMAKLQDGHTSMSALSTARGGSGVAGPLRLGVAADAVYVRAARGEHARYLGSRVRAVNGLPLNAVIDSVRTSYPSENVYGGMDRLRRLIEVRDPSWPTFMEGDGALSLTLETVEAETVTVDLDFGDRLSEPTSPASALDLTGDNSLLYGKVIRRDDRPVGYFVWNAVVSREVADEAYRRNPSGAEGTFDWVFRYLPEAGRTGDMEKDLRLMPSLYERFSELLVEMETARADDLIIDLRRNGGGMTPLVYTLLYMLYGDAVLTTEVEARYDRRLSELYLTQYGADDIARYNEERGTDYTLGEMRRGYLFKNDLSLPLEERRKVDDLTFSGYGSEYWTSERGRAPFSPNVVVLTSASTFSAAFHFTYFLKEIGSAVVVGVPPRQAPNAFMEATRFELPNSHLSGTISNAVQVLYPPDDPGAKLFKPDFTMTWDDFRRYDFDPNAEVLFALELIESGRASGEPGEGEAGAEP